MHAQPCQERRVSHGGIIFSQSLRVSWGLEGSHPSPKDPSLAGWPSALLAQSVPSTGGTGPSQASAGGEGVSSIQAVCCAAKYSSWPPRHLCGHLPREPLPPSLCRCWLWARLTPGEGDEFERLRVRGCHPCQPSAAAKSYPHSWLPPGLCPQQVVCISG